MTSFVDVYLPDEVPGYPSTSVPIWNTGKTQVASGHQRKRQRWVHPLHRFVLANAEAREHTALEALKDHWMVMHGPFHQWPWRDPLDFASRALEIPNTEPTLTIVDQVIGTGNGVTTQFQLTKTYARGGKTYVRDIKLPVVDSVIVGMNALTPDTSNPTLPGGPYTWDVTREGGVVEFDHAPTSGVVITAGFLFDVPVAFESDDSFEGVVRTFQVSGFAGLTLVEERLC